jgi:spore coat protein H
MLIHPGVGGRDSRPEMRFAMGRTGGQRTRGNDAFIYMPPGGEDVQLFDFVDAPPRKGGFKIHFRKDELLRGMTTINVIFEGVPRYALAEALSYEVYRMAGVPAELTEHIRVWIDGNPLGYHLLIEQPNKAFLARNKRDTTGNLYKLLWYGNGIIGKHEKKTNPDKGHDDLVSLIDGLERTRGTEQWSFIRQHFNVEEFINYFAVNMCIQNWDGFHNNYFAYHDTGDTGRWEIYPWDEDKTWGDYDGASRKYDWYELPLTYAMSGAQPPPALRTRGAGGGGFIEWWREPGYFSGPLLANPEFRQRFLLRMREICNTVFTEEKIHPLINQLEKKLEAEIPIRATINRMSPEAALAEFRGNIQSFRNQVIHRRKFMLAELEKLQPAPGRKTDQSTGRVIR